MVSETAMNSGNNCLLRNSSLVSIHLPRYFALIIKTIIIKKTNIIDKIIIIKKTVIINKKE